MALGKSDTNVKAVITAEDKASVVVKKFGDNVDSAGKVVANGLKIAAAGLIAGTAAAVAFGASSLKAFTESEDAIAQTNAVLKSTGNIAGVTADAVQKLATSLEKTTKFSDEEIRSAENLLLTFTSIGKDIFPQATKTVLDMSQALGQDLKSSSVQLGKALQDPILGVTALRRVGVNFSQSQQDVISKLVETGQKAKAQQLILKELNTEFGGSAEAAGSTYSGTMIRLKNQLNNVQEAMGEVIAKGLIPISKGFLDWMDSVGGVDGVLKLLDDTFRPIAKNIIEVAQSVGAYLTPKIMELSVSIQKNLLPLMRDLWHGVIEPMLPVLGTALVVALGLVIDAVRIFSDSVGFLYNELKNGNPIVWAFAGAFGGLAAAMAFNAVFDALTVGFATMRLITIPSTIASIEALKVAIATPAVMPAIVIGAALVAIAVVANKFADLMNEINSNNTKIAQDQADTKEIIQIGKDYKAGKINAATRDKLLNIYSRASGGAVTPGNVYAVGDNPDGSWNKTTELFVPSTSGTIINSEKTQGGGGGGGGANVTFNVTVGMYAGQEMEKRKIAMEIFRAVQDVAASQGTSPARLLGINT